MLCTTPSVIQDCRWCINISVFILENISLVCDSCNFLDIAWEQWEQPWERIRQQWACYPCYAILSHPFLIFDEKINVNCYASIALCFPQPNQRVTLWRALCGVEVRCYEQIEYNSVNVSRWWRCSTALGCVACHFSPDAVCLRFDTRIKRQHT